MKEEIELHNSGLAEWIMQRKKENEKTFFAEIVIEQDEPILLTVRQPDGEGGYVGSTEDTFEYENVNDIIEDLLVCNKVVQCERY